MSIVSLGLGSNIDAENNLQAAARELKKYWPNIHLSSVYRSKATDFTDQSDFLNAVAMVETDQSPQEIKTILESIESALGKSPPFRFGPRTIDLDILLYEDAIIDEPNLIIPHPRMHERRFVLEPLLELNPALQLHPILQKTWQNLLKNVKNQHVRRADASLLIEHRKDQISDQRLQ